MQKALSAAPGMGAPGPYGCQDRDTACPGGDPAPGEGEGGAHLRAQARGQRQPRQSGQGQKRYSRAGPGPEGAGDGRQGGRPSGNEQSRRRGVPCRGPPPARLAVSGEKRRDQPPAQEIPEAAGEELPGKAEKDGEGLAQDRRRGDDRPAGLPGQEGALPGGKKDGGQRGAAAALDVPDQDMGAALLEEHEHPLDPVRGRGAQQEQEGGAGQEEKGRQPGKVKALHTRYSVVW